MTKRYIPFLDFNRSPCPTLVLSASWKCRKNERFIAQLTFLYVNNKQSDFDIANKKIVFFIRIISSIINARHLSNKFCTRRELCLDNYAHHAIRSVKWPS